MHRLSKRVSVGTDVSPGDFRGVAKGLLLENQTPPRVEIGVTKQSQVKQGPGGVILYAENGFLRVKSNHPAPLARLLHEVRIDICEHISIGSEPPEVTQGSVIIGRNSGERLREGSDLILVGESVGRNITQGSSCVALGKNSLNNTSSVGGNVALGESALGSCGQVEHNICIGNKSGESLNDSYNISIGPESLSDVQGPLVNHNVAIGREAMKGISNSTIDNLAMGMQAMYRGVGNLFQNIIMGHHAGRNISAINGAALNNVGIGTEALENSRDVLEMICMGSQAGRGASGSRAVLIGSRVASEATGSFNSDVLIGTEAGARRGYLNSHIVAIGDQAASESSGDYGVHLGAHSFEGAQGRHVVSLGSHAGGNSKGNGCVYLGPQAGFAATGGSNFYGGSGVGRGVAGSRNVWLGGGGSGDAAHPEENKTGPLDDSVVLGFQAAARGREAVVIGSQAGQASRGYLNKDILIGSGAGLGQSFGKTIDSERKILAIGANAAVGNLSDPSMVDSEDIVCIGHSAGHSSEQKFNRVTLLGNNAGSFSSTVVDTVAVGHSSGLALEGSDNVGVGNRTLQNVHGSRNLFLGSGVGDFSGQSDNEISDSLLAGCQERIVIQGDVKSGNLLLGAGKIHREMWTDGTGSVGLPMSKAPVIVSEKIGGVLYSDVNHQLCWSTHLRDVVVSSPLRFVKNGNIGALGLFIDLTSDSMTVIKMYLLPSVKQGFYLNEEIILTVRSEDPTLVLPSGVTEQNNWEISVKGNLLNIVSRDPNLVGLAHFECIGTGVLRLM